MRSTLLSSVVVVGVGAAIGISSFGCTETECGPGTINRAGQCEPADETVGVAKCGPSTELRGDQCVPKLPPTKCDPTTTQPDVDAQGVTTCIGTGGGGCSAPLACPAAPSGKLTLCGQIYKFTDSSPFAASGATGAKCQPGATEGPCALKLSPIRVASATEFVPATTGEIYRDDCGRYRVPDIDLTSLVAVVLNFDDPVVGPGGDTVPTAVATRPPTTTSRLRDFDAWVVDQATTANWDAAGGPKLALGIYAAIFRTHACDDAAGTCNGDRLANRASVRLDPSVRPGGVTANTKYFVPGPGHVNLDTNGTMTSNNGTVISNPILGTPMSGLGGIDDMNICQWDPPIKRTALTFPNTLFFQVFRPLSKAPATCTQ